MRMNLSSAYDVRAENAVHVNLCLREIFQTRMSAVKNGVMRMMSVMESYYFCSKTSSRLKSGGRFEEVGGRHSLISLIRVKYVLLNTKS